MSQSSNSDNIDGLVQECRKVTPLLMHCSYCSLALSHRYIANQWCPMTSANWLIISAVIGFDVHAWCQVITSTDADILSIRYLCRNFSEIRIKYMFFVVVKLYLNMSFAQYWPFGLGLNVSSFCNFVEVKMAINFVILQWLATNFYMNCSDWTKLNWYDKLIMKQCLWSCLSLLWKMSCITYFTL